MSERVSLIAYDPEWPRRFDAERALLESVLGRWLDGGIHHIGSTAIPGIAAKPIIDMLAGVRELEDARGAVDSLREHAYLVAPHRAHEAHHFVKPSLAFPAYSVHLTQPGSDLWRERLAFRDALRSAPALAAEYEALKLRLAQEHGGDRVAYTRGKRAFVARVLGDAGIELRPRQNGTSSS